ncbi:MAG: hypothetical protein JXL80_12655 [Planctomycetes bacterium]|nr:hypothetical protein [Planctomycetota bacterium]
MSIPWRLVAGFAVLVLLAAGPVSSLRGESPYAQWTNGPPSDPNWFPIGVWLQSTSTSRIAQYQAAGFNIYVGLWQGPTESQLANLKTMGMKTICSQNTVGLTSANRDVIIGWAQQDEPDNAQWNSTTQTYDPPILPSEIVNRYNTMKANDDTRPVFLNLGQGVAWDGWWGRGTRTNHPEDYPLYLQGCDIASFDIYPFASSTATNYLPVKNKPWLIPYGVDRLNTWKVGTQTDVVWNFVECTNIHGYGVATPTQVKAEVWMSLVHGSMGILYFVHQIDPTFIEAGLLADPVMTAAVTATNNQIQSLAPVLNSPTIEDGATVQSSNVDVPVDIMVKEYGGATYLFAVGMRDGSTTATFQVAGAGAAQAEVLGESRTITVSGGSFQDAFTPYAVHLYRITQTAAHVTGWQVVGSHGAAGDLATDISDDYIEPRLAGLGKVRIQFDAAINPATLVAGAVTVVGQSHGDQSGTIASMTLDGSQRLLTVTFSPALPDVDTYTITATSTLRTTGGLGLEGDTNIVLKALAGDLDGSGEVSAADLLAARAASGETLTTANARYDADGSGTITSADLRAMRPTVGHALP